MRKLGRVLFRVVVVLVIVVASAWGITQWISRKQTEESLARQAAEIAAHRQAQRTEPPVTPPVTPSGTPSVTAAAPDSPTAPAIAWTTHWTDFRGPRRDGHYTAGPIRTDWTTLKPLWRSPTAFSSCATPHRWRRSICARARSMNLFRGRCVDRKSVV